MKLPTILLLALVTSFCFGQQEAHHKLYIDANFGLLPTGEDLMHGFNLSAGHQFSPYMALGLSLNRGGLVKLETARSTFGLSLEPRLTYKRFRLKLNGGIILNARYSDGTCTGARIDGPNFYFRPAVEYRLGLFTFGFNGAFTPNLKFSLSDSNENQESGYCLPSQTYHLRSYDSGYLFLTVGISFPQFTKM